MKGGFSGRLMEGEYATTKDQVAEYGRYALYCSHRVNIDRHLLSGIGLAGWLIHLAGLVFSRFGIRKKGWLHDIKSLRMFYFSGDVYKRRTKKE